MPNLLEKLGLGKMQNNDVPLCYLSPFTVTEFGEEDAPVVTLQAFKLGETVHDNLGNPHEITKEFAEEMLANFKTNARGIQVLTDWEHGTDVSKGKAASGEVVDMRLSENADTMEWDVKLTPEAVEDLKQRRYRYFSPTWLPKWVHNSTRKAFNNIAIGGAFTNRPIQKTIAAINFAEVVTAPDAPQFGYVKDEDGELVLEARPDEREPGTYGDPDDDANPYHQKNKDSSGFPGPPLTDLDSEKPNVDNKNGGETTAMDEEQLKKLREMFSLPNDATPEQIIDKVAAANTDATKFAELNKGTEKVMKFAEDYPEEFAWMQEKKQEERDRKATEFAEAFQLTVGGKTFVPTQVAKDKLKETHLKYLNGEVAFAEVQNAITELVSGDYVELGERGTANGKEDGQGGVGDMSGQEAAVKFSELTAAEIKAAKADGKTISTDEARAIVAEKHPEVVQRYMESFNFNPEVVGT